MSRKKRRAHYSAPCKRCAHRGSLCQEAPASWKKTPVVCVGLSAKLSMEHLDSRTLTGKAIDKMEAEADAGRWHRTNLVKFAPCSPAGKLRYPTDAEMLMCAGLLRAELTAVSPVLVVTLGAITSSFLEKHLWSRHDIESPDSRTTAGEQHTPVLMPVKHPSYVSVYRRSTLDEYIADVADGVASILREHAAACTT